MGKMINILRWFICIYFICFNFFFLTGQIIDGNQKFNDLSKGVFLENINVLVPWRIQLDSIKFYGNPKIVNLGKNYTEVQWDSIKVFNGISLNLRAYFWNPPGKRRLRYFYSYINSSQIDVLREHLNVYLGIEGIRRKNFYEWATDKSEIRVGNLKNGKYYFWLKRE